MSDLSDFSVDELAAEVRRRVREDEKLRSFWPDEVYGLMTEISVIPCVDCLLVRQDQGKFPELGFSIRNTGFYAGKKWMAAGGRINRGESLSGALKRHVKTDLGLEIRLAPGLEWNVPILVSQHGPEVFDLDAGEYAGDERSKFCVSATYLVVAVGENVVLGEKAGGQESAGLVWYAANALPPDEDIAYGGQTTIRRLAAWAIANL